MLVESFVESLSNQDLSNVYSIVRLGLLVLGRKPAEVKCHSHRTISGVHAINLTCY